MRQPTLFISHGAPNIAVKPEHGAHRFLKELGADLPRPEALVVFSAHWRSQQTAVSVSEKYETLYDFGNFDSRLFEIRYEPPGRPELAREIAGLLGSVDEKTKLVTHRGIDHGAWIPLYLMFPKADVPVVLVSLQADKPTEYQYRLGSALRELATRNILVIGSGGLTHNLRGLSLYNHDDPPPDWVTAFSRWFNSRLENGDVDDLIHYRERAPHARENHPTEEHLLPLYIAMGAGSAAVKGLRLHTSSTYGTIMMDMYAFNG